MAGYFSSAPWDIGGSWKSRIDTRYCALIVEGSSALMRRTVLTVGCEAPVLAGRIFSAPKLSSPPTGSS